MVSAVRRGMPMRAVARRSHVSLSTVQRWVERARGQRLNRVDWSSRPKGRRTAANRTSRAMEDMALALRRELKETSDLGDVGAVAIRDALVERGHGGVPCVRTIGYILERRGVLDGRKRPRRPPPPPGWYLPDLAAGKAELDSFDIVEGLVIRDGPQVEVLTGTSLHGGLVASWPMACVDAKTAVEGLIEHWRAFGRPRYAQFDNDTRFQGPHQHPDVLGRVVRTCLSLEVVPVFAPPRETGFQAAVENLNGRWQARVWARFHHESLAGLRERSDRFVAAARHRMAARIEAAPRRHGFPADWRLNLQQPPRGQLIYLRRTDPQGAVTLLGHSFPIDPLWPHRLVRAVVDIDAGRIRFYALRRRNPRQQPLLRTVAHKLPHRPFQE